MEIYELHKLIENFCPITGLKQISENEFSIDYSVNATYEQKQAAQNILYNLQLYTAKQNKLKQIDQDFENITKQGWDSGQGFSVGITTQDVSLLVGLFVLAKEGAALGIDPPPIIDTNGNPHQFTMQELTVLMLQYGSARAQIAQNDATRRKAVENATTIEELNNI